MPGRGAGWALVSQGRKTRLTMNTTNIQTKNLKLVLQSSEDVLAHLEEMSPSEKAEVSPDWLARVQAATSANPWTHGFVLVHRASQVVVGRCGFKGPPEAGDVVEIAYGVDPDHQGKGYATEAAETLTDYAFRSGPVRVVRAHTRLESNASARVLTKCGFQRVGEVLDPEDGRVWRWEKSNDAI